ncbi:MAG: sialate O-acetylesterase [Clostridia bacterium]|nr:sialate O-acetylesterase [Oscillospiraceae bacterium]MBR4892368.1 sialate O-acetylesterase [Clostridia bacterium]
MLKDGVNSQDKIISFLMIGQSNMAGRGEFLDVDIIDNDKCFMLRMGRWQKMSEPINPDRAIWGIRFHSGISLAASFADSFTKEYKNSCGLIPCADGGTKLSQWMPGEILFDHAVMMCSLAKRTSQIGGILWHQGESDCTNLDPQKYKKDFILMINTLRKELGNENLPVLIGELSEDVSLEWVDEGAVKELNKTFYEIEKELNNCKVVSAKNLNLKEDKIHFDSHSLREFGLRYFEKYKELV